MRKKLTITLLILTIVGIYVVLSTPKSKVIYIGSFSRTVGEHLAAPSKGEIAAIKRLAVEMKDEEFSVVTIRWDEFAPIDVSALVELTYYKNNKSLILRRKATSAFSPYGNSWRITDKFQDVGSPRLQALAKSSQPITVRFSQSEKADFDKWMKEHPPKPTLDSEALSKNTKVPNSAQ